MFDLVPFKFDGFERNLWPSMLRDDFFSKGLATFKTDITETETSYLIEAELPGYSKEELNIEVSQDRLTISAKKDESTETKEGNYLRRERRTGHSERTFILENVDQEAIRADFKDGILRLTLPKLAPEPPKNRKIDIN